LWGGAWWRHIGGKEGKYGKVSCGRKKADPLKKDAGEPCRGSQWKMGEQEKKESGEESDVSREGGGTRPIIKKGGGIQEDGPTGTGKKQDVSWEGEVGSIQLLPKN